MTGVLELKYGELKNQFEMNTLEIFPSEEPGVA